MRVYSQQESKLFRQNRCFNYGLIALLIAIVVAIFLLACVPPVSRDALTHHLYVPKLYLQHSGIYEISSLIFSYYPMNLDLLYMGIMHFGSDILPKYIHMFFGFATGYLIYRYLKQRLPRHYALLGSLFFLTIPIIVKLSITVYVDLGLVFFTTASLLLLFYWVKKGFQVRYLIFAGLCCGLAAGTKYNGLINIVLLPLLVPILYIRSRDLATGISAKGIGFSILFILAALLAFSPWLIKNYTWTGNPIYPLHNSFFQQNSINTTNTTNHSDQEKDQSIFDTIINHNSSIFVSRKVLYQETWWQTLLLPLRFFFAGQDDNPRYFDGKLNPFLLILPFFAFIKKSANKSIQLEKYTLLSFSFLFFFFTFFQEAMRIRYIVCIVPPLVILSIFGLQNIVVTIEKLKPKFLSQSALLPLLIPLIIVGSMLLYNGQYLKQQFQIIQPLSFISGHVSRDQYITRFRPEFSAIKYANNYLKPNDNVLCIFLGNRGYYMNFIPIFDRPTGASLLTSILSSASTQKSLKIQLLQRNIKYILLRHDLTNNWFQHLNKKNQALVTTFFGHDTEELFNQGGHSFFRIRE